MPGPWPAGRESADFAWALTDLCETRGIDSIWLSDRLSSPTPVPEVMTTLAAMAARTTTLKFGPSVIVLPYRTPVVAARESGYRLAYGSLGGERIVDVEQNWTLNHEDLPNPAHSFLIDLPIGSGADPEHGTAVLGVVGARENAYGVTGISPRCELGVSSTWRISLTRVASATLRMEGQRPQAQVRGAQVCGSPSVAATHGSWRRPPT